MLQRYNKKKKGSPLAGPHLRPGSVSLLKHTGVRPGGEGRAVSPTQRPFREGGGPRRQPSSEDDPPERQEVMDDAWI